MESHEAAPLPRFGPSAVLHLDARLAARLGLFLVAVLAAWLAAGQVLSPPAVVPASAPAGEFSGERAMAYLDAVAAEPHTVGSQGQARVRDYLLGEFRAMGLSPVLQEATGAVPSRSGLFASRLQNILVRIPGTASTGAVAIMAHYDSQPNTAGASDNGAAVAGILESARALQAGPGLRNDVIFVLTDAEEVDAQGADAFYREHPWARDIRLLVNFEAAGDTGASVMLETSRGNSALAEGFVRAVPHPVAYSFMTQLLRAMPIGTDMNVFAENDVPSIGPMFGWHYHTMYHSRLDNVGSLDARSVQHQGENALGLARYFGNQDLSALDTSTDAVFFSVFPGLVIRYPAGWAMPAALLVALIVAAVVVLGFRRSLLSLGGVAAGVGVAVAGILIPAVVAGFTWSCIVRLHPEYWRNLMGAPYGADFYLIGLAGLVLATSLSLFQLFRRKIRPSNLAAGALLVWLVPLFLTARSLPGMSYFFAVPVLAAAMPLVLLTVRPGIRDEAGKSADYRWPAGLALSAALILLICVPIFVLVSLLIGFWFLTMNPLLPFVIVPLLFLALMLTLMPLQLETLLPARRLAWLVPGLCAALSAAFLLGGSLSSGFGPAQPMPVGVWYQLNADTGSADWYSYGTQPADPWTAQFFPGRTEPVRLNDVYRSVPGNPVPHAGYRGPAPAADLSAPEVTVVSDQTVDGTRTLRLHLASLRGARGIRARLAGAPVLSARINGIRQREPAWAEHDEWFLRFYGAGDRGLDLDLEVRAARPLTLDVTDQSDGLPALQGVTYTPRSPDMMPFAIAQEYMPYPETTSVGKTVALR